MEQSTLTSQTIEDFGAQWTRYRVNEGYYASVKVLQDIMGPLVQLNELRGKFVADIGSGTGRIVNMLLDAGASKVRAIEPSEAFHVMKENTKDRAGLIEYHRVKGDELPGDADLDLVVSFGVLHHIPNPHPVVQAAHRALKPGGKIVIWLYGEEGNRFYLAFVRPVRMITRFIPDALLQGATWIMDALLQPYIWLCKVLPMPMKQYFLNHYVKLTPMVRRMTLFDQLNPSYAKYYREEEARALLELNGFADVKLYHRHGYSWTVVGVKA